MKILIRQIYEYVFIKILLELIHSFKVKEVGLF